MVTNLIIIPRVVQSGLWNSWGLDRVKLTPGTKITIAIIITFKKCPSPSSAWPSQSQGRCSTISCLCNMIIIIIAIIIITKIYSAQRPSQPSPWSSQLIKKLLISVISPGPCSTISCLRNPVVCSEQVSPTVAPWSLGWLIGLCHYHLHGQHVQCTGWCFPS